MKEFIDKLMSRLEEREVQAYAKMCGGLLRTEESSSECRGCKDGFCCNVLQWLKSEAE